MRPWLLLVSLLSSDLSPLGDGDRVMENYSWSLRRKLPLNGQMTPRGPETLQTRSELHCLCIQRDSVYVVVQHKQRTSPFYWAYAAHCAHGCSLSHQEFPGIIHRNHIPALPLQVAPLLRARGKIVPAFVKSDSEVTPIKGADEASHAAMDAKKNRPDSDSGRARLLYHHKAPSGHDFQAASLEKPENWAPTTIVQLHETPTRRGSTATTVIVPRCFRKGDISLAARVKKITKQQMARTKIRQRDSTRREMNIEVLMGRDGQRPSEASLGRRDVFRAATLRSGSPSVKTSHASHLQIRRKAATVMKKNERFSSDEEPAPRRSVQRQHPLKAASVVHDDDGFDVERRLLFVSRERAASINRPRHEMRAAQDDNKKDFSGKIITKQAELRRPEGGSGTARSSTNAAANGNRRGLTYIRRADFKADNNGVDQKRMLCEVGEEVLIMLLLPDTERETQTETASQGKLILNTDTGWKTVKIPIKELDDPPPVTKVVKENFIITPDYSHRKFKIYAPHKTQRMALKPAQGAAEAMTTASAYTEKVEHTENNTPRENMSINHAKHEENVPPEESVIPPPPSLRMMETQTAKTERTAEMKETTPSMGVFNRETDGLPSAETKTTTTTVSPESDTGPRSARSKTNNNTQTVAVNQISGLRMRQDLPADMIKLQRGGAEVADGAATNGPGAEGKEDQNHPRTSSSAFAKPSQTIHKQAAGEPPTTADDSSALCRGLVHRTEAGWRHCLERLAGTRSKMFPSREATDAFKDPGEREHPSTREHQGDPRNDDGYDHFYYFDGVLRRVQNGVYTDHRRQTLRKRGLDNAEKSVLAVRKRGDARENLLSYIRRLALRNKASHF